MSPGTLHRSIVVAGLSLAPLATSCGEPGRRADDGSAMRDSGVPSDAAGVADAGGEGDDPADAGGGSDAGRGSDAGTDGSDGDAGGDDGESEDARVDVVFDGCSPDFSGALAVVRNRESIAVSSTKGGSLTGSIQLDLRDERGTVEISTKHRIDTGAVINVVVDSTWTNIARDSSAVVSGEKADPIDGRLEIDTYDEAAGRIDVDFANVMLQNHGDGSICTVDGRLQTFGLSF